MKLTLELTKKELYDDIFWKSNDYIFLEYDSQKKFFEDLKNAIDRTVDDGFEFCCKEREIIVDGLSIDKFIEINKKELIDYFKDEFEVFFSEDKINKMEVVSCCANCKRKEDIDFSNDEEIYCGKRKEWVKTWNKCKYWK